MTLFPELPSREVIERCRQERGRYHAIREQRLRDPRSPACAEVFRRAFANDQEAWAGLRETFEPLMRAWIGGQKSIEPEDVMQVAFLNFSRAAPRHPEMVAGDELGTVLTFWQKCVRTALLELVRKKRLKEADLDGALVRAAQSDSADSVELRLIIHERLDALLHTSEEWFVFQLFYLQGFKQDQIMELHPNRFADKETLNTIIQRVTRRLRNDRTLQSLRSSRRSPRHDPDNPASLQMRRLDIPDGEDQNVMTIQCTLGEEALIDYVLGIASAELRAEVERSPACVAAAARITNEISGLVDLFQTHACPDPMMLVSYVDQELTGTELLVIRKHAATCLLCQEEIELLNSLGPAPSDRALGSIRRLVEAIFRTPLELQIMGSGTLTYETPDILISLALSPEPSQARRWLLQGEIRTPDGLGLKAADETARIERLDPAEPAIAMECAVEPDGAFLFDGLAEGRYRLIIRLAEQDVTIRQLVVGDLL